MGWVGVKDRISWERKKKTVSSRGPELLFSAPESRAGMFWRLRELGISGPMHAPALKEYQVRAGSLGREAGRERKVKQREEEGQEEEGWATCGERLETDLHGGVNLPAFMEPRGPSPLLQTGA